MVILYRVILGLYLDNANENGNYYIMIGYRGLTNYQYYGKLHA